MTNDNTAAAPHTPPMIYRAHLSELDGCWLDVRYNCGCQTAQPFETLRKRLRQDRQVGEIVSRLVCKKCRQKPATIHLRESYGTHSPPGADLWSVQLFPPPLH